MQDRDLEIRGGRSSRPLEKGGEESHQKIFSALRASLWSKNKRGPGAGAGAGAGAGPPAPYPGPATDQFTMGKLSGLVFSFSTKR